jgi:hypothetical protein
MENLIELEAAVLDSPASDSALLEEFEMAPTKAKPPEHAGEKSHVANWITAICAITVAVVSGTLWIAHQFSVLDKHISRVETAVRIVGAKEGGDTKTLIDEALQVALLDSKAGRIDGAKAVLAAANRWITEQNAAKIPATQQSFTTVLEKYQDLAKIPALSEPTHDGLLNLAEYRGTVAEPPRSESMSFFASVEHIPGGGIYLHDGSLTGERALVNSPQGTDIDGFVIKNVVFKDAVIVYRGGPLTLSNVTFINCRFIVPNSQRANELLAAVVQQPSNAQIS